MSNKIIRVENEYKGKEWTPVIVSNIVTCVKCGQEYLFKFRLSPEERQEWKSPCCNISGSHWMKVEWTGEHRLENK